jgi:hypothetical protein
MRTQTGAGVCGPLRSLPRPERGYQGCGTMTIPARRCQLTVILVGYCWAPWASPIPFKDTGKQA